MIKNIAELLQALIKEEASKLDEFNINHAPTIGEMYEGLTADILIKAIPKGIDLRLVSGVIHDGLDNMTGQIDCMLVKGEGQMIPHTTKYKWLIKDVIAVFEIKKTLYSKDLKDAFLHLNKVLKIFGSYAVSGKGQETFDISPALRAFEETTGRVAPSRAELDKLPFELQIIYHTLVIEQVSPIRIIFGYHGFKSENNLRNSIIDFLDENKEISGFGVRNFPQLIISGNYSLVKMNGLPYSSPMNSDYWDFYASSRANPILLVLEFIWTRLSKDYNISGLWGEDLKKENLSMLLSGKVKTIGEKTGWEYISVRLNDEILKNEEAFSDWEPTYVTSTQFPIFQLLCNGKIISVDDTELLEFLNIEKVNPDEFFKELTNTGLVALNGKILNLVTDDCNCVTLPNGKFIVAENNTGRLTNWLKQFKK